MTSKIPTFKDWIHLSESEGCLSEQSTINANVFNAINCNINNCDCLTHLDPTTILNELNQSFELPLSFENLVIAHMIYTFADNLLCLLNSSMSERLQTYFDQTLEKYSMHGYCRRLIILEIRAHLPLNNITPLDIYTILNSTIVKSEFGDILHIYLKNKKI